MSTAAPATPTAPALNPKLIIPFINSVKSVFSTMLSSEVKVERPSVKSLPGPQYDASGVIAFSGNIVGTVVVSFEISAANKIVERFAGAALEPGTPDFADALGEITNMIAGSAKKDLGALASISTPTVILGRGHTIARPSDVPCLLVPCVTDLGTFAVEIAIANK